jgi:hypothetical protein
MRDPPHSRFVRADRTLWVWLVPFSSQDPFLTSMRTSSVSENGSTGFGLVSQNPSYQGKIPQAVRRRRYALVVCRRLGCRAAQILNNVATPCAILRHPDKKNRGCASRDQCTLSLAPGVCATLHGHLHSTRQNLGEHARHPRKLRRKAIGRPRSASSPPIYKRREAPVIHL